MQYRLVERSNPQNRQDEPKLYATPVTSGKVSIKELATEIERASSLSRGDVTSVIINLLEIIPSHLIAGRSIDLGELGWLRLTFRSKGVKKSDEWHTSNIHNPRVVFKASVSLREQILRAPYELTRWTPVKGGGSSDPDGSMDI